MTLLLTDVQGSTALWSRDPEAMAVALALHDRLAQDAVARTGGTLVKSRGEGDSTFSVFLRPSDAARAAVAFQRLLADADWPAGTVPSVRAALHTGEVQHRDDDYYGTTVNRCARLRDIAHGGQTVCSRVTADLVAGHLSKLVSLRALGSHRLKDLDRPEDVYELSALGHERDFPPLRSLRAAMGNLPEQLDSFVGRERDVGQVIALLDSSRLVTLVGPGGVGKTRLAVQVGAQLAGRFPGGVWLTELAPLAGDALVEGAVAAALGVREDPLRSLTDALVERLAEEPTLVVVDNCEHVVDGAGAVIERLLRRCRGLSVVATSIEPLRVTGETLHHVGPLGAEARGEATSQPGPAVRLFLDRATAVDPAFQLDQPTEASVARLCQRLDGIPLAIELAAACVATLAPEELEARLDQRFSLLTSGVRTAAVRHRSLRAVVDWSVELLQAEERHVLERLAVFRDGATVGTIEEVMGGKEIAPAVVVGALSGLVDRSLVFVRGERRARRYYVLETIRLFGEEQLRLGGTLDAARDRHLSWVSRMASDFAANTGGDQVEWLARMRAELANLRAALEWSASSPERARQGLEIANNMLILWAGSGLRQEGVAWIERLVRTADGVAAEKVGALLAAAWMASLYWPPAVDSLVEVAEQLEGDSRTCRAMTELIRVCRRLPAADHGAARECLERAEALAPRLREHPRIGDLMASSMATLVGVHDPAAAARELQSLRRVRHDEGDNHLAGAHAREEGLFRLQIGDEAGAREACEEALAAAAAVGCLACRSYALSLRSVLSQRSPAEGGTDAREALLLSDQVNDNTNRIEAWLALLVQADQRGQYEAMARMSGGVHSLRAASDTWHVVAGLGDRALAAEGRSRRFLGPAAFDLAKADGAALTYPELLGIARAVLDD